MTKKKKHKSWLSLKGLIHFTLVYNGLLVLR